ncbi:Uncharacterized protein Fot_50139 [Forsythia ovata]|uniref:Uncharacterized protein n=1 Tax=Forsythia ovata TaxID=205694 RepID=A0ABD1PYV5_9LAMI
MKAGDLIKACHDLLTMVKHPTDFGDSLETMSNKISSRNYSSRQVRLVVCESPMARAMLHDKTLFTIFNFEVENLWIQTSFEGPPIFDIEVNEEIEEFLDLGDDNYDSSLIFDEELDKGYGKRKVDRLSQ